MRNRARFGWATADEAFHAFVDKSRKKPYQCGICGRDITDPYHQPALQGTVSVVASRNEPEPEAWEPEPKTEAQMQLSF
jgi:hypothetical protein